VRTYLHQLLTNVFGLDTRSLAVLRIGFGLILLIDLALRAADLRAMVAGDGILPIDYSIAIRGPGGWSLHGLSGGMWLQWLLFAIASALAAGMLVGWRTRWMVVGSWLLLTSLHMRNPLILNAGDSMLRILLFWSIFLPLGAIWSLDARAKHARGETVAPQPVASVGTFCFILQLCIVYWCTGLYKLNYSWLGFDPAGAAVDWSRVGGEALQRAMSYDLYRKPLAEVLLASPELLRAISIGTVLLELFAPLLLFVPFGTRWWRVLVICAFLLLHIGIELTLHVGLFGPVAVVAWMALLPQMFWDSRPVQWLARTLHPLLHQKRAQISDRNSPEILSPTQSAPIGVRALATTTCLIVMLMVLVWNVSQFLGEERRASLQRPLRPIVNALALGQRWAMFSRPIRRETWFVYRATLPDGRVVDVFRDGQPVSMSRPTDAKVMFKNHRWRKLHATLNLRTYKNFRQPVAEYVFRRWNEEHPDAPINRLDLYQVREDILPEFSLIDFNEEWCLTIRDETN
jgi:hypothetical protein